MADVIQEFIFGLGFGKVDTKPIDETEKKAREAAKRVRDEWAKAGKDIGKSLAIAGGAALGAAAGLFKFAESSARAADEIGDTAVALGVSARELQRLRHGMQIAGGNVESFDRAIKKWTTGLSEAAAKGIGPVAERLDQLGLSAGQLVGLGLEDQIGIIADSFQGLADEQEKAAIAADLFGAKADIKQLLERSSAGVRELGDEAERLGLVLGQDALDAAGDFTDSIDRMKAQLGAIARDVGLSLIPTIQEIIEQIRDWASKNRELIATRLKEVVMSIANALKQLLPALMTLLPAFAKLVELSAKAAEVIGPAGMTGAMVGMRGAMSGALGPIGAVTTALALLVSTVITAAEETQDLQFALDDLKSGGRGKRGEGTRKLASKREGDLQASRDALVTQLDAVTAVGQKRRGSGSTSGFAADQRDRAQIVGQIREIDAAIAKERERAGSKAAFDADVQRESAALEQRTQARINAKRAADAAKKGKGGGSKAAFEAEFDEYDFEAEDLFGDDIRGLADSAGVDERAYSAAIKAAGSSLREGSTAEVAKQAARSRLGGLTGKDYSAKGSSDPLLSAIFGENVPDVELSKMALGATPQTLIATINNNFAMQFDIAVDGAGNPADVAAEVHTQSQALWKDKVAATTKLVKPAFHR